MARGVGVLDVGKNQKNRRSWGLMSIKKVHAAAAAKGISVLAERLQKELSQDVYF